MHVTVSTPSLRPSDGGAERWVAGWVEYLRRAGHRVSTVSFGHLPHQDGVEHHRIDWIEDPFERIDAVDSVVARIGADRHYDTGVAGRSDVLHLHAGSSAHSIRAVEAGHGRRSWPLRRPSPAAQAVIDSARRQEGTQARRSGWVVSLSSLAAAVQRRDLLVPAEVQRLVPPGVDLVAASSASEGARERLRERWSIPSDGVAFLLVAHNPRLKGAAAALAATRSAVEAGVDAYLVVAGARLDDWMLGEAIAHGCSDRLVMAGIVDPIAEAFAAADVLVHPTRWDAFGSVVLEAMAAGLPVVTTEAAGVAEVIVDGRSGFVLPADAPPRRLHATMVRLGDGATRNRFGAAARQVAERYPIEATYRALEDVLCGPLPSHHERCVTARRRVGSSAAARSSACPNVSVVMPVRDGAEHVSEAIESVLGQSFEDFDLHVVDDGSSDGTDRIVEGFAESDSRVVLHRREKAGIVAALEHGIRASAGRYVARMDADDICMPDRLERQVAVLDDAPTIGVLGSNYVEIRSDGSTGPVSRLPVSPFEIAATLTDTNPVAHPTVMMRRCVIEELGGYRDAFPLCEDYDLWLRASEICDIANLEEVLLAYRRKGRDSQREQRFRSEVAAIRDHHLRQIRDQAGVDAVHPAIEGVARRRLVYMIRHDLVTGEGFEAVRTAMLAVRLPGLRSLPTLPGLRSLPGRGDQANEPTNR